MTQFLPAAVKAMTVADGHDGCAMHFKLQGQLINLRTGLVASHQLGSSCRIKMVLSLLRTEGGATLWIG